MAEQSYTFFGNGFDLLHESISRQLHTMMQDFFGTVSHCVLVYGDSIEKRNKILAGVELIAFAPEAFCTPRSQTKFQDLVLGVFEQHHVPIDPDLFFDRELLVPFTFAERTPDAVSLLTDHAMATEDLELDKPLHTLIFDVMIMPKLVLSGSLDPLVDIQARCEKKIINMIRNLRGDKVKDAESFATIAIDTKACSSEAFLSSQQQPSTLEHLEVIWHKHSINMLSQPCDDDSLGLTTPFIAERKPFIDHHIIINMERETPTKYESESDTTTSDQPPCVLFLNGFPGVGKYTVAKALQAKFPDSILIKNHLLIDLARAIFPYRSNKHYRLRKKVRDVVFEELKREVPRERIIIFTSCSANT